MAFDLGKLMQAEMLQAIGFVLFFAGQATVVSGIAKSLPAGTAGVGALLVVVGAVMKIIGRAS